MIVLTSNGQLTLWLLLLDNGTPAMETKARNPPVWSVDNPDVLTLTTPPDGNSCVVTAGPLTGNQSLPQIANVTAVADGVTIGPLPIQLVTAGTVASGIINASPLQPKGAIY